MWNSTFCNSKWLQKTQSFTLSLLGTSTNYSQYRLFYLKLFYKTHISMKFSNYITFHSTSSYVCEEMVAHWGNRSILRKNMNSGARRLWFKVWLCHLLLYNLGQRINFFTCTMGIIALPHSCFFFFMNNHLIL